MQCTQINPVAKILVSKTKILCLEEVHFCYFTDLVLEAQLDITGRDVNQRDENGWLPLDIAAEKDLAEAAEYLIQHGANVNSVSNGAGTWNDHSPLHRAAEFDSVNVARVLIRNGANLEARTNTGMTPLHWAAKQDSLRVATLLKEAGANIYAIWDDGGAPVGFARSSAMKRLLCIFLCYMY